MFAIIEDADSYAIGYMLESSPFSPVIIDDPLARLGLRRITATKYLRFKERKVFAIVIGGRGTCLVGPSTEENYRPYPRNDYRDLLRSSIKHMRKIG
jgi:hypothetical protein